MTPSQIMNNVEHIIEDIPDQFVPKDYIAIHVMVAVLINRYTGNDLTGLLTLMKEAHAALDKVDEIKEMAEHLDAREREAK